MVLAARLVLVVLVTLIPASLSAADDCADALDQRTMNGCADETYKAADSELNAVYQEIVRRLAEDTDTKLLLVKAQRAWIGFRDAECDFATSAVAGGSIYPTICAGCAEALTLKRSEELKSYLACEEGDLSCPVPND